MSDRRLRELERTASQGDLGARARWLTEQLRRGALSPDRLELAAYLGDPAAGAVLERPPQAPARLVEWALGLGRYGQEWVVRALIEGARHTLPQLAQWFPDEHRPARALDVAEACLGDPTLESAVAAHEAAQEALGAVRGVTYGLVGRYRDGALPRRHITAVEYVAWACHDAADNAYRVASGDRDLEVSALPRLDRSRAAAGIEAAGTLRAVIERRLIERALG